MDATGAPSDVVLRNVPTALTEDEVAAALQAQGLSVRSVTRFTRTARGKPPKALPLCRVACSDGSSVEGLLASGAEIASVTCTAEPAVRTADSAAARGWQASAPPEPQAAAALGLLSDIYISGAAAEVQRAAEDEPVRSGGADEAAARPAKAQRVSLEQDAVSRPAGAVPPAGYACNVCGGTGHWRVNCPTVRAEGPQHLFGKDRARKFGREPNAAAIAGRPVAPPPSAAAAAHGAWSAAELSSFPMRETSLQQNVLAEDLAPPLRRRLWAFARNVLGGGGGGEAACAAIEACSRATPSAVRPSSCIVTPPFTAVSAPSHLPLHASCRAALFRLGRPPPPALPLRPSLPATPCPSIAAVTLPPLRTPSRPQPPSAAPTAAHGRTHGRAHGRLAVGAGAGQGTLREPRGLRRHRRVARGARAARRRAPPAHRGRGVWTRARGHLARPSLPPHRRRLL